MRRFGGWTRHAGDHDLAGAALSGRAGGSRSLRPGRRGVPRQPADAQHADQEARAAARTDAVRADEQVGPGDGVGGRGCGACPPDPGRGGRHPRNRASRVRAVVRHLQPGRDPDARALPAALVRARAAPGTPAAAAGRARGPDGAPAGAARLAPSRRRPRRPARGRPPPGHPAAVRRAVLVRRAQGARKLSRDWGQGHPRRGDARPRRGDARPRRGDEGGRAARTAAAAADRRPLPARPGAGDLHGHRPRRRRGFPRHQPRDHPPDGGDGSGQHAAAGDGPRRVPGRRDHHPPAGRRRRASHRPCLAPQLPQDRRISTCWRRRCAITCRPGYVGSDRP